MAAAAANLVPVDVNSSVLLAAALSVPLSLLVLACLACRRCRRRGRGTMLPPASGTAKYKDWNVGDILGRSKDGFQPVDTDERELLDDSDSEVEEFSLPASQA